MPLPLLVPGYAVGELLGTGGDGSLWSAREEATGRRVALRLVPLDEPAERERARRESAMLTVVAHAHLLPLLGVVDVPEGLVVVAELAEAGSLEDLLARRGTLPPGEVVTSTAPIAQALADLHIRGFIHGDVTSASVLFSAEGKPMLSDLGTAALRPPAGAAHGHQAGYLAPEVRAGQRAQPGSDVYGLAAVALRALTGYVPAQPMTLPGIPPATQSALAAALEPDPRRRPDAAALANAFFVLAEPLPVVFTGYPSAAAPARADEAQPGIGATAGRHAARARERAAAVPPGETASATAPAATMPVPVRERRPAEPHERRRRQPSRRFDLTRVALLIAIPVILAGAVFAGLQWFGDREGPDSLPATERVTSAPASGTTTVPTDLCGGPQPAPTAQPPEVTDWTQVVEHLYTLRSQAFATLDASLLCDVYAPTSSVLAKDARLLQLYAEAGGHTEGLEFEVVTAELVSQEAGRVVLNVTDRLPPYRLVDDDGTVVKEWQGLPQATWQAELVPAPDASSWRFS
ncbi:MAG: serine/threonine protein kinase [Jiangellaceae bacterium]|nr:serine/threonine protein kinase [Jiangellaceae bacterium]